MSGYLYRTLSEKFKYRILRGCYKSGTPIPSIRTLAEQENCNSATIQRALKLIEEQGLIYHRRSGVFWVIDNTGYIDRIREREASMAREELYGKLCSLGITEQEIKSFFYDFLDKKSNKYNVHI